MHGASVTSDLVRADVDLETTGADDRLRCTTLGAPQHGVQPRNELAGTERLRHVVVGAGIERTDLLGLLADRRENEDRHLAPLPQAAAYLDTVAVRQDEVD